MIIQLSGVLVRALYIWIFGLVILVSQDKILMMRLWDMRMIIQLRGVVARALYIWIFWIGHIGKF